MQAEFQILRLGDSNKWWQSVVFLCYAIIPSISSNFLGNNDVVINFYGVVMIVAAVRHARLWIEQYWACGFEQCSRGF